MPYFCHQCEFMTIFDDRMEQHTRIGHRMYWSQKRQTIESEKHE